MINLNSKQDSSRETVHEKPVPRRRDPLGLHRNENASQYVTKSLAENSINKRHVPPHGLRMLSPNQEYAVLTKTRQQPPSPPIPASTEPDDGSVFNAAIELEQSEVLLLKEGVMMSSMPNTSPLGSHPNSAAYSRRHHGRGVGVAEDPGCRRHRSS